MIEGFSLKNFSKSSTNYDLGELNIINEKLLKILPFNLVKSRLEEMEIKGVNEFIWQNLQANLSFLSDIKEWVKICQEPFKYHHKEEDKEFLKLAEEC